jgi:hypothetical protein
VIALLAAAGDQSLEDVGKAGPIGLAVILLLLIAAALLVKSMGRHLKKIPRSFDPEDQFQVPDTPEELLAQPPRPAPKEPGQDLLDELRRAPRAIEPPRGAEGRPDRPPAGS